MNEQIHNRRIDDCKILIGKLLKTRGPATVNLS